MNVFYIPSFYPSASNPIYGIFVKEQMDMLARELPESQFGVAQWGQGDPAHQLWVRKPFSNLLKIARSNQLISYSSQYGNRRSYYSPVFTWTQKLGGNLTGLLNAVERQFLLFRHEVGRVDFLHVHATYPGALIASYLKKKYQIPFVVTLHMSPWPFPQYVGRKGSLSHKIRPALEHADRLITPSPYLEKIVRSFGFTQVETILNPVDVDFFKPNPEMTKSESPRIFAAGRMEPQKGFDLLIRAIATLGKDFKGQLRIAGNGSKLSAYKRLAQDLGVENKISWLGLLDRKHVRDEMQRCDFFVLSSRHETLGNVVFEAMCCGKPVLITPCGGPEAFVNEEVGICVNAIDSSSIAKGIQELSERYTTFTSNHIRLYVYELFGPSTFARKISVLSKYINLINN